MYILYLAHVDLFGCWIMNGCFTHFNWLCGKHSLALSFLTTQTFEHEGTVTSNNKYLSITIVFLSPWFSLFYNIFSYNLSSKRSPPVSFFTLVKYASYYALLISLVFFSYQHGNWNWNTPNRCFDDALPREHSHVPELPIIWLQHPDEESMQGREGFVRYLREFYLWTIEKVICLSEQ